MIYGLECVQTYRVMSGAAFRNAHLSYCSVHGSLYLYGNISIIFISRFIGQKVALRKNKRRNYDRKSIITCCVISITDGTPGAGVMKNPPPTILQLLPTLVRNCKLARRKLPHETDSSILLTCDRIWVMHKDILATISIIFPLS